MMLKCKRRSYTQQTSYLVVHKHHLKHANFKPTIVALDNILDCNIMCKKCTVRQVGGEW